MVLYMQNKVIESLTKQILSCNSNWGIKLYLQEILRKELCYIWKKTDKTNYLNYEVCIQP